MFRLLKPVPGIEIDPSIPEGLALRVNCMGPSRIDLVNDLMPRSVMLTPAIVLSKLKAERSVMARVRRSKDELQGKLRRLVINFGKVTSFESSTSNNFVVEGFQKQVACHCFKFNNGRYFATGCCFPLPIEGSHCNVNLLEVEGINNLLD